MSIVGSQHFDYQIFQKNKYHRNSLKQRIMVYIETYDSNGALFKEIP